MPDAEGGVGAADIGFAVGAGSGAGVETHAHFGAGELFAEAFELTQRAGVDKHSGLHEVGEIFRQLLRGERDAGGGDVGLERALHFPTRGGVEVQAGLDEEAQDRRVRAGLHGETHGETEGAREGERGGCLGAQRGLRIHVGRRAIIGGYAPGGGGREEAELFHIVLRKCFTARGCVPGPLLDNSKNRIRHLGMSRNDHALPGKVIGITHPPS